MKKSAINETLRNSVQTVKFEKADGTIREMKCTLMDSYLPDQDDLTKVGKTSKRTNDDVIACWDLEAKGWRSFRIDRMIEMTEYTPF